MTQKQAKANIFSTPYLTRMAILVAIASILFLVEIPVVAFYKLDLSNIPVLLGAFSMGTVPGVIILALKSLIGLMHSSSAGVGELADFLMGAAFVIPAAMIYHRNKTRKTALIGMAVVHGGGGRDREQIHHAALLYGRVPYEHGRHPEIRQRGRRGQRMEAAAAHHRPLQPAQGRGAQRGHRDHL